MTLLSSISLLGNTFSGMNSSSLSYASSHADSIKETANSEACCRRRRHCNRVYIFGDVNVGGYGGYGCGGYGGYDGY